MKHNIGIVIVNWNNKSVILPCLESILKAGYLSCVVVVDNGSTDDSVSLIKKQFKEVRILKLGQNMGFSGGNNQGIKYLLKKGKEYILILNPDTKVTKGAIGNLQKVLEKDEKVGIVGPKILTLNGRIWSCGGKLDKYRFSGGLIGLGKKDKGQYQKIRQVDFISGTAMLVKREVFKSIGFLENKYFIYHEDVDFCLRAKRAGFKSIFVPKAIIYHKESSSFGKNSPAHQYYLARNHLLFVERNAPFLIKLREFIRLPKTIFEHLKKEKKFALIGIRDYFLRRFSRHDYWS